MLLYLYTRNVHMPSVVQDYQQVRYCAVAKDKVSCIELATPSAVMLDVWSLPRATKKDPGQNRGLPRL